MRSVTPKPEGTVNAFSEARANINPSSGEGLHPPIHEIIDAPVEEILDAPNWGFKEPKSRRNFKRIIPYLITGIVFSGITFGGEYLMQSRRNSVDNTALILHGGQTINENQLRKLVVSRGLNVYWLGSKPGMKYLINTSQADGISLRCISTAVSAGSSESYYDVGTFVSQNAFALTQKAAKQPNGVGFVNIDGNAVYYDSRDPKNVYIGLKNADIQVEIYDPRPDQALAAALLQGNLKRIT